jgi:formamidopyrimidine-DNA glycosylase
MFGTFHIYNTTTIKQAKELTILGPDAIGKDFNPIYLFNITRKSSKHIKTFILDQSNVAGIGNIYADEILYASHINPLKPTRELTKNDCTLLVNNCQKILQRAIKAGGTTFATFASAAQKIGSFQNQLQVYGKENKMCEKCHHKILKIKINGRGSCYCPHCQKN